MNCPNCGGPLNVKGLCCDYCNSKFTYDEIHSLNAKNGKNDVNAETKTTTVAPEKPKTLTEQRQEEIAKEKANRPKEVDTTSSREIVTGAAVMGCFSLFAGVRRFFRELKRTVCLIILVALEIGFGYLMISDILSSVAENSTTEFVMINAVILAHALVAGIVCRIGRLRFGTILVGIVNFLAVIWVFVYPLIATDFAGADAKDVAILAVIEMVVLALSVLFTHLISGRR